MYGVPTFFTVGVTTLRTPVEIQIGPGVRCTNFLKILGLGVRCTNFFCAKVCVDLVYKGNPLFGRKVGTPGLISWYTARSTNPGVPRVAGEGLRRMGDDKRARLVTLRGRGKPPAVLGRRNQMGA